jgi:hypothetical protein
LGRISCVFHIDLRLQTFERMSVGAAQVLVEADEIPGHRTTSCLPPHEDSVAIGPRLQIADFHASLIITRHRAAELDDLSHL